MARLLAMMDAAVERPAGRDQYMRNFDHEDFGNIPLAGLLTSKPSNPLIHGLVLVYHTVLRLAFATTQLLLLFSTVTARLLAYGTRATLAWVTDTLACVVFAA